MTFRYIGSKARLVEQLAPIIGPPTGNTFVDAFCGTGAVAELAAQLGWDICVNDNMNYATIITAARLISIDQVHYTNLGGYAKAIESLNSVNSQEGYIWKTYSPGSQQFINFERKYFTEENAQKIDGIRLLLHKWKKQELISELEEILLLADLLSAVNRIANIAGTYGCFLSKWTQQSLNSIKLTPRKLKENSTNIRTLSCDVFDLKVGSNDVVYLDPPYTKRQYASYYHLLETICLGDKPEVEGVCGLRPWQHKASEFCYKVRALKALTNLIEKLQANKILLSYSSEGHIELENLANKLSDLGNITIMPLGQIGRYRPNKQASSNANNVSEYLIVIDKHPVYAINQKSLEEITV